MKLELKDITKLMDNFANAPIHELMLKSGDTELLLKKETSQPAAPSNTISSIPQKEAPPIEQEDAPEPQMLTKGKKQKQSGPSTNTGPTEAITSPLVGTFYRSPSPDSPPFASEGSIIKKGKSLAIIEAMKIMNHLEADYDMEVVRIFAENGDLVEFGAKLFEVRRV